MASEQVIEKVAAAVFDVIHPNAAGAYANFKGDLEYMDVARAAVAAYEEAREGERGMAETTASPSAVTSGSGGDASSDRLPDPGLTRAEGKLIEAKLLTTGCGCALCEERREIVAKLRAALGEGGASLDGSTEEEA